MAASPIVVWIWIAIRVLYMAASKRSEHYVRRSMNPLSGFAREEIKVELPNRHEATIKQGLRQPKLKAQQDKHRYTALCPPRVLAV